MQLQIDSLSILKLSTFWAMTLEESTLDRYSHYSSFSRPPEFRLEPSADIIYLPPTSFSFKTNPEYFQFSPYTAHRQSSIETMTSTQSDDMEAFQRLSDQYQPDVTVGDDAIVLCTESKLIIFRDH